MITVLPIKGYESLKAMNAYHTLLLGLKMLPSYMGESYDDFYSRVELMEPKEQEKMIREAVLLVPLQRDEVEAMAKFTSDKNGVPFSAVNLKNLGPDEIMEIIVAVSVEISKIKINFVSESEKKNSIISQ